MAAKTFEEAKFIIERTVIEPYSIRAVERGNIPRFDRVTAEKEYRHFWLLVWMQECEGFSGSVIPTKLADEVWHEHLKDRKNYEHTSNLLIGRVLGHIPGFKKGSLELDAGLAHTRALHKRVSDSQYGGFVPVYLSDFSLAHGGHLDPNGGAVTVSGHDGHDSDGGTHSDAGTGGDSGSSSCGSD